MLDPDAGECCDTTLSESSYELLDFGNGRKLERFGEQVVDRPSPAADGFTKRLPKRWRNASSLFDPERKNWQHRSDWPTDQTIDCGSFRMPIAPTPFGHLGIFPEQQSNWDWLNQTAPDHATNHSGLNLFAYTGASSIAMAVTGLKVAHVDAAKPNVAAARAAAELNHLQDHPIRYLVDDAAKFVAREIRRGNRYHTIVLDPPAYGHSPSGKTWRLERDLWPLLDDCLQLLEPDSFRLVITGHSPQIGAPEVLDYLRQQNSAEFHSLAGISDIKMESGRLQITDCSARPLDAGFYVRCHKRPLANSTDTANA